MNKSHVENMWKGWIMNKLCLPQRDIHMLLSEMDRKC